VIDTGINDPGGKFATGINNTGGVEIATSGNDTSGIFYKFSTKILNETNVILRGLREDDS
jgi:hypothetical protein